MQKICILIFLSGLFGMFAMRQAVGQGAAEVGPSLYVTCGSLFDGKSESLRKNMMIVTGSDGKIKKVLRRQRRN